MKSQERLQAIVEMIPYNGYIMVNELSSAFNVTEETIRRDLIKICSANPAIKKIHGGVFRTADNEKGAPQKFRETLLIEEKTKFADICASIPQPGDCIMLDSSTTSCFIAQALRKRETELCIVTNSIRTASLFVDSENVDVTLIGGRLRKSNGSMVGPASVSQLEKICADFCFISPTSVDCRLGATDVSPDEAAIRAGMIQNSRYRILVADHTKFGSVKPNRIAGIEAFNRVIADSAAPIEQISAIRQKSIEVTCCL